MAILGFGLAVALSAGAYVYGAVYDDRPVIDFGFAGGALAAAIMAVLLYRQVRLERRSSRSLRLVAELEREIAERKRTHGKLEFANTVLATAIESAADAILVVDEQAKIIAFNRNFVTLSGVAPELVRAGDDARVVAAVSPQLKDPEGFVEGVRYIMAHPDERVEDELEYKDGRVVARRTVPLLSAGRDYLGRIFFLRDITEHKRVHKQLESAYKLLEAAMENSPDGMLVVDPTGKIISYNRRFFEMWGLPESVADKRIDAALLQAGAKLVKDPEAFTARVRHLYDHPEETANELVEFADGRVFDRHSGALYDVDKVYLGRIWFFRDITEQKKAQIQIAHLARHDVLTGLYNRAVFAEAVKREIARVRRTGGRFAVLYLDLDHFKDINDTLGHPVGDLLLKAVAERLSANIRETDTVARFGGDEFAVLQSGIGDPTDTAVLASKLAGAIAAPYSLAGKEVRISASIGIAFHTPDAADAETLLSRADIALYRAKSEGRRTYRLFTDAMDAEVRSLFDLGNDLRKAIASDQLYLVYQPQLVSETGELVGLEALLRWKHPVRGTVMPGEFIPAAEKSGLIPALGRHVLRLACRQAREWLDAGVAPATVAVNISGLQFKAPVELERNILAILDETGLPAHLLGIELTETTLMETSHEHNEVLQRLRRQGVKIALDDFGTGYSSLQYLRGFPVDLIKIAQDFIKDITVDVNDAAIVKAAIGLARALNIDIIAEGVETAEQATLLSEWGCRWVQGFHYARPMSADAVRPVLTARKVELPVPVNLAQSA